MEAPTGRNRPDADATRRAGQEPAPGPLDFVAYRLSARSPAIVPADPKREWMEETPERFAYRCLPMLIANQAGWFILNTHTVRATWGGGVDASSLKIEYVDAAPADPPVVSHFGSGVLTWRIPILFRTPPEFNLWVRGPANLPKPGAYALEGIVETDWSVATFTMNWKLLVAGQPVTFEAGEPICMVVPQRKDDLERFAPRSVPLGTDPELAERFMAWAQGRHRFIAERKPGEWQKDYFRGSPDAQAAGGHRTRLALKPFRQE